MQYLNVSIPFMQFLTKIICKEGIVMFANKLRELRNEKNISQFQLANIIHATQTQISKWENGAIEPSLTQLQQLANALEVSTDYLLGRENDIGLVEVKTDLTTDEQELINLYRKLSFGDKNQLLGFAKGLVY